MLAVHIFSGCHRYTNTEPLGILRRRVAALLSPQRYRLAGKSPAGTLCQTPRLC